MAAAPAAAVAPAAGSGAGGATVVANTLHVLQARVVTLTPEPVKAAGARARAAFRAKPWASTATALALASWSLNLIAFFVRWMTFSNGAGVRACRGGAGRRLRAPPRPPARHPPPPPPPPRAAAAAPRRRPAPPPPQVTGYITLTEVSNCLEVPPSAYTPAYECGVYQLLNNAPTAMKWIYSAGAASLSFLIFAFVASSLATWLTYLRRINSLHTLPGFMHSLHGENIMVRRGRHAAAAAPRRAAPHCLATLPRHTPPRRAAPRPRCLRRPPSTRRL